MDQSDPEILGAGHTTSAGRLANTTAGSSDGFAFLVPKSKDARLALRHRHNLRYLVRPLDRDAGQSGAIKLDFASFFGRLTLSFGSARACVYRLPDSADVSECHFTISFDLAKATLLLTDTSRAGTWVSDAKSQEVRLVHNAACEVLRDVDIGVGRDSRYRFRMRVQEYIDNPEAFAPLLEQYSSSVSRFRRQSRDGKEKSEGVGRRDSFDRRGIGHGASEDEQMNASNGHDGEWSVVELEPALVVKRPHPGADPDDRRKRRKSSSWES